MGKAKPGGGEDLLKRLEADEREVSRKRGELLAEIDQLRGVAKPTAAQEARLKVAEEEEDALSAERRNLQHQVDALRMRFRLPQGPPRPS